MNDNDPTTRRRAGGARGDSLAVRLYALAVRAFPPRIRRDYGNEMVAAFAASHAAALSDGAREARRYTLRASLDALTAGLRERVGSGGVGAPPPRTPAGRALDRSRDALWRELGSDLRFAARTLRRAPGFALTVIVILALGVGINGAIFTAVEAALLAPLPFPEPDELLLLEYTAAETDPPTEPRAMPWSWPKFQVMAEAELPLDSVAGYGVSTLTISGRGDAARLQAEVISTGYFDVLGVDLPIGRPFADTDDGALEVILSNGLWRERFGADTGAIGDSLTVNGHTMTIVGVAPPGFRGLSGQAQLWVPVPALGTLVSPVRLRPQVHWLQAIGRAADGVTTALVDERLDAAVTAVDEVFPFGEAGMAVSGAARPLVEARRNPRAEQAVTVVAGAAGLILLIACVNLASLMLARGGDRRREIAVRLALGGSRARVARGLVCETLLLAGAGGLLGAGVAALTVRAVGAMWPESFRGGGWNLAFVDPAGFAFDGSALAYTVGLGLLAGVLFGAGPALRLSRTDLGATLKEGGKSSAGGGGRGLEPRRWLAAAEIAAATVLLVGAALMLGSLARLLDVDTGFNEENLLVFEYALPRESAWADNPAAFHEDFFSRLRALPRVEAAAGGISPLRGYHWSIVGVIRAGERVFEEDARPAVGIQTVTDDYFATLQTPVLRGRTFDSRDQAGGTPAMVISETAARELFGDTDPIGRALAVTYGATADGTPAEVIGVVADVLYDTPENGTMAEAYFLQRQNPEPELHAMVRTRGEPYDVLAEVRATMAALDPGVALYGITTAEDLAAAQVADTRIIMQLLGVFAALSVLLAATGIWGVVSYSVVQRRRELGIRMALGAHARQAVAVILRRGLLNATIGIAAGLVAALALSRYLESLLYEVDATNPAAFAAAALLLFTVALLAAWVPALRATRVHPSETLRTE